MNDTEWLSLINCLLTWSASLKTRVTLRLLYYTKYCTSLDLNVHIMYMCMISCTSRHQWYAFSLPAVFTHLLTGGFSFLAPTQLLSCSHHRTRTWKSASSRWTHDTLPPVSQLTPTENDWSLLQEINTLPCRVHLPCVFASQQRPYASLKSSQMGWPMTYF